MPTFVQLLYYHYQSSHEHFTSTNINLHAYFKQASTCNNVEVYPIRVRTLKTLVEFHLAKRLYSPLCNATA